MRAKPWILASFALNCVLAGALYNIAQKLPEPGPKVDSSGDKNLKAPLYKTNVVVRRQNFTWDEVESDDYPTFIANLRTIGCPESTIRDIIVADVDELFARKRTSEVVTPDQQWWKSDPDEKLDDDASRKETKLNEERRELLTRLLGPGWEKSKAVAVAQAVKLGGAILGILPEETKAKVSSTYLAGQARLDAYFEEVKKSGKEPDPREVVRLRQQMRQELAVVLNPIQMEEFLLRYSETADSLRDRLRGMDTTPDEFRKMFRATDTIEQELEKLAGKTDQISLRRQRELRTQLDNELKRIMPPERFTQYQLQQDPAYRETKEIVQAGGLPERSLMPVYQINQLSDKERLRIANNRTLSEADKSVALEAIDEQEQLALRQLLGDDLYDKYKLRKNSAEINKAIRTSE